MKNFNLDSYSRYEFEHFFDLSPDLLCIADFEGNFKHVNPAVSKLLGFSYEELISRPISTFVHPEDRPLTKESRQNVLNSNPLLNFENRYITKDGKTIWLSWTTIMASENKLIHGIAKNITIKKRLEDDRNQYLTNLTKSHQDLRNFCYTTSHDLRSPLNNLLSIIGLFNDIKIADPEIIQYLDYLKSSVEGLNLALNNSVDILTQNDKLNIQVEELSLITHLNSVLDSIRSLLLLSKVSIEVDFSELETIKFNQSYLESILLNLITNSIKYARVDVPPIIKIYSKKNHGTNQLIISDNGLGFDMDQVKEKVFGLNQKFHHHHDSKGVGLYLVNNHITSLGGNISLDSRLNEGATFIISFKE